MTNEEKIMFYQWIDMNGGKEGSLYMTFSDEELEQIFLTSITISKKNKKGTISHSETVPFMEKK